MKALTKGYSEESTETYYSFTFYCDICGKAWSWTALKQTGTNDTDFNWETAFNQANLEAAKQLNRCPTCQRWICDDCFCLLEDGDYCTECAKNKGD